MTRKKVAILQLFSISLGGFCGLIWATQSVANYFGNPASFERHLLIGSIYKPWAIISWFNAIYGKVPKPFDDSMLYLAGTFMVGIIVAARLKKLRPKPAPTEHGSAHFADEGEVKTMGFVQNKTSTTKPWMEKNGVLNQLALDLISDSPVNGVVVGSHKSKMLSHDGSEHILVFAPTRSGKGVGIVVPTLLSWRESVVVLDVKGENWNLTSGWRSTFSHTLYFNPTDESSIHYNPLAEIRNGQESIRDVANLVETLCSGDDVKDDFWTNSAKSLLKGIVLYVLHHKETKTLAEVLLTLRDPDVSRAQLWAMMVESDVSLIRQVGANMRAENEKTSASIISTAIAFLNMFDDPTLSEVTSRSDFSLRDLQFSENPVSLYLVIPPSDINRLKPLLRLMLSQIGTALTESLQLEGTPNRLLMLLDEFPILGKVKWLESALAYVAGYSIKMMLIAQDLNQIESAYGANNAILGNCHVRVAFASNDEKTAKRISDLLGQTTGSKQNESLSGKRGALFAENSSKSTVLFGRPLMTPGEIMQMGEQALIFVAGSAPLICEKVRYYEELTFVRRCPGLMLDGAGLYSTEMIAPSTDILDVPPPSSRSWETVFIELEEDEEEEGERFDGGVDGDLDENHSQLLEEQFLEEHTFGNPEELFMDDEEDEEEEEEDEEDFF